MFGQIFKRFYGQQSEDEETNRVQNENWIKNDFLNHSIEF